MKLIESSSNRLVVRVEEYKTNFWDVSNSFQDLAGILGVFFIFIVVWHESGSLARFSSNLIIGFSAALILLIGNLSYVFFNQRLNLYKVNSYIFNQNVNSLSIELCSIWGTKEIHEICPLSEIMDINLKIFSETNPKELTPDQPIIKFKTSYQVKMKFYSEIERIIEHNSISAFSNSKTHDEFRSLITQTENVVKEILAFLEISAS